VSNLIRRQQVSFLGGGLPELQKWIPVVCLFILLARASGQDAGTNGTNTATNQPGVKAGSTNQEPTETIEEIPAAVSVLTNQPQPESEISQTNQFGEPLYPPPQIGPAGIGTTEPTAPLMGTSVVGGPPGAISPVVTGPGISLWGPIDLHPHLLYTYTYGNGVQSTPGRASDTAINIVAPGFLMDLGLHWSIDYTPSLSFYSSSQFQDTVNQAVLLRGFWNYEDWSFNLSQGYIATTEPLVETGMQTAQEGYTTTVNATRQMGDKMSLELAVNQNFRLTPGLTDLHEWTTADWLNYQVEPVVSLGLGLTLGYDDVSSSSAMPFEDIQGRISFTPGTKLSILLAGGGEDRQFLDPDAPPLITPIFSGTVMYQICPPTMLALSASRSANASYFANQVEVSTSFSGSIRQQLSKKMSLTFSGSYSTTPSTTIAAGSLPQYYIGPPIAAAQQEVRNDTITSFQTSFSYLATSRITFSLYYLLSQNSSGQANFAYASHQFGFSLNYQY
jgi:hypothetical protein